MAIRTITKELAGAEDVLLGQGTVTQVRGGNTQTISKINAGNIPFQGDATTGDLVPLTEALTGQVAGIAALRAMTPVDGIRVLLQYHTSEGDGGAGIFRGVATGAYTDNNGTIVSTGTGAWLREYSGAVNVRWFGATGDGSTNDAPAIQAALTNHNDIFIPFGSYIISTPLVLRNSQTVIGAGAYPNGTTITANGCDAFHITAKDTYIANLFVGMQATFYAFTYAKPSGETSSFNNINRDNYVDQGNGFKLTDFSRSFIHNFNSNNLDIGIYMSGNSLNSCVTSSLFQGHNDSTLNVAGQYGLKVGVGIKHEGINFTDVKFISFYDGIINDDLEYSTFTSCVIDVITNRGYTHTGYNKNITFDNCYFAQIGTATFATSNGYKAFIEFSSLPADTDIHAVFNTCYFVCYTGAFGPDILCNIRENNRGITFINCDDRMSQTNQSIALFTAKGCNIVGNTFGEIVSDAAYTSTPNYVFDPSNKLQVVRGDIAVEYSRSKDYLTGTGNTGTLDSNILFVNAVEPTKSFKVWVRESTSTFLATTEYLVTLSYYRDHSVNNGIQVVATSSVDSGALGRVVLTLSATTSNTDKKISFIWVAYINTEIQIERVL